ncbi:MAG TPA: S16 family serine protease, partial [Acidobacteriota bacterium]|nr:S16 family serine protease [Acidobacteriota bacterium]
EFGIDNRLFQQNDFHIHIPEGAIPKDGPSAGVTIATAFISLCTNTKVRWDVAMTGEITLRGNVLPVGGVKEKVLAAQRMGVKRMIMPLPNKKDLFDIPKKVIKTMEFIYVEDVKEVLANALVAKVGKKRKKGGKKAREGREKGKTKSKQKREKVERAAKRRRGKRAL